MTGFDLIDTLNDAVAIASVLHRIHRRKKRELGATPFDPKPSFTQPDPRNASPGPVNEEDRVAGDQKRALSPPPCPSSAENISKNEGSAGGRKRGFQVCGRAHLGTRSVPEKRRRQLTFLRRNPTTGRLAYVWQLRLSRNIKFRKQPKVEMRRVLKEGKEDFKTAEEPISIHHAQVRRGDAS